MPTATGLRAVRRPFAGGGLILTQGGLQGYVQGCLAVCIGTARPNPTAPAADRGHDRVRRPIRRSRRTRTARSGARAWAETLRDVRAPVMFTTDLYDYVLAGACTSPTSTAGPARLAVSGARRQQPAEDARGPTRQLDDLAKTPIQRFVEQYVLRAAQRAEPARLRLVAPTSARSSGYARRRGAGASRAGLAGARTRQVAAAVSRSRALSLQPPTAGDNLTPLATVNGPKGELRTLLAVFGAIGAARGPTLSSTPMLEAASTTCGPTRTSG